MMEYKGYLGKVEVEDDEFYGVVVNLHRDHLDFRGRTIDEVREAFHDSVDFYLKGCKKDGEEPERPFSGSIRGPPASLHTPEGQHSVPRREPELERGRDGRDRDLPDRPRHIAAPILYGPLGDRTGGCQGSGPSGRALRKAALTSSYQAWSRARMSATRSGCSDARSFRSPSSASRS